MLTTLERVMNWISRHLTWLFLALAALYTLTFVLSVNPSFVLRPFMVIIMLEAIAIGLCGVALWAYTHLNFTRRFRDGEDGEESVIENLGNKIVMAAIFIGVHLLCGLGYSIIQFGNYGAGQ